MLKKSVINFVGHPSFMGETHPNHAQHKSAVNKNYAVPLLKFRPRPQHLCLVQFKALPHPLPPRILQCNYDRARCAPRGRSKTNPDVPNNIICLLQGAILLRLVFYGDFYFVDFTPGVGRLMVENFSSGGEEKPLQSSISIMIIPSSP